MCNYWQVKFACTHPPELLQVPCKSPLIDWHPAAEPPPLCRKAKFPKKDQLILAIACWRCWTQHLLLDVQMVTVIEYHAALLVDKKNKWTGKPLLALLRKQARTCGFVAYGRNWQGGRGDSGGRSEAGLNLALDCAGGAEGGDTDTDGTTGVEEGSETPSTLDNDSIQDWGTGQQDHLVTAKGKYPSIMLCCPKGDIASGETATRCGRHTKSG